MSKENQNVVQTTREQNMAAAKACGSRREACELFMALQHATGKGTTQSDYDELEKYFGALNAVVPYGGGMNAVEERNETHDWTRPSEGTCNGWTNRNTWLVWSFISNSMERWLRYTQFITQDSTQELFSASTDYGSDRVAKLRMKLKGDMPLGEVFTHEGGEVNWDEIAEGIIEFVDEVEKPIQKHT